MKREDARDAMLLAPGLVVSDPANPLAAIPQGAVVGTASVRRQAMLSALRPDLVIVPLRGNIDSRLAKLEAGKLKEGGMELPESTLRRVLQKLDKAGYIFREQAQTDTGGNTMRHYADE
jgi:porphobilinogen deaminase